MHPLADTGRVIAGRYRLQAPIGRGAMGVVWRARDQLLDREVAVKEVHIAETLTDQERAHAYQRTLREAKTAARLNHPAVVTVYDVAEDEGRPWIVMQLVHAQSLDQVLAASGPLSPRRAAEMGRQLLSALSVAHAAGVMHRDVKPSNVLLGQDDRAVLTDFGIATFQGDPKLTQTGMVMGSPGFTAPERIRGEDASPASDLWSLGATLFAALEGHGPFEKRGGAITTMSAIINEDAPEAPTAGALGPVIAALLRREPADRPDASVAARMITDVLPLLTDRTRSSAGYEPTALSASSYPASPQPGSVRPGSAQPGSIQPGSFQPRSVQPGSFQPGSLQPASFQPQPPAPGETSLDFASAEQTRPKEPLGPAAGTGPPGGGQAAAAQTAPTVPQPVQGSAARPEGPPLPDFSSWYDSSPRSGPVSPAPQPGSGAAWSGSAPPVSEPGSGSAYQPGSGSAYQPQPQPQPGYGAPPWSGGASQQAPGSPPWSDPRPGYPPTRRRRPGLWWKIAAAVLAIVGAGAGVATVVLLHQSHSGTSSTRSTTSSTPSTPATGTTLPPANLITAINQPLTGPSPAGYRSYSQAASGTETAGFTIDVPVSWAVSQTGAYQTNLTEPGANIKMLVDLTPHTYPSNMVQEAQYIEARSIPHFPGYQRIDLRALTIRDTPGSFWKFTWMDNGVSQTALDLLFILNTPSGQQSYALYATAPTSMWQQMQPVFDEELRTFARLPK
jgi:serine/threonine protein kinase